jgi:membrane-associated PAP2 superfamily phosphatase
MPARFIPLLILGVLTLILRWSNLDMALCRQFFAEALAYPWKWAWCTPCEILYHYGLIPAWMLFGAGCLLLASRARQMRFDRAVRSGLFLVLVFGVGPGLLVNLILKPGYGRPRPRDVVEFGGRYEFVPVLTPSPALPCTSFPSGHAAMGFYLMAPAFLVRRRSRLAAALFAATGLLLGSAIGMVRIVQGGHFASDIVWSAGIVYITALVMSRLLGLPDAEGRESTRPPELASA